jgi:hypothetical protein
LRGGKFFLGLVERALNVRAWVAVEDLVEFGDGRAGLPVGTRGSIGRSVVVDVGVGSGFGSGCPCALSLGAAPITTTRREPV